MRWLRRPRFWILIYLALLVCSFTWQAVRPDEPAAPELNVIEIAAPRDRSGPARDPIRIAYRDLGSGDDVVLLFHGSPGSHNDYKYLQPMLAERFRTIAIDMVGFGDSQRWARDYGIEAQAEYALSLLDALEIDRAHVVGFSLGSGPAIQMAAKAPDRVASLTFISGIGIQEGEGTGDYHFEHLKYAVGFVALVVVPEFVPHFGLLGSRAFRHGFVRSFMDTDQRPLRGILESLERPLLILHGRDDFLVPPWVAEEHHWIVKHSQLVMFDASHFMVYSEAGSRQLADQMLPFLVRHSDPDAPPQPRTTYLARPRAESPSLLPAGLDLRRGMSPWTQMAVIIVSSYILEDPTTVATGLLIRHGSLDFFVGIFALFIGIFTGDIGLYLFGRILGRRLLRWPPIEKRLPTRHVESMGSWLDRHGWWAVLASRFVPGSRLPLYVAAGAVGKKAVRFALWTLFAVVIWAVVMITIVMILGEAATSPFRAVFGDSVLALIAAIVALVVFLHNVPYLFTTIGRWRLLASISRLWRWEFWPTWLFYIPVVPCVVWLSLRRGGFQTITATNPGIPDGGFVGESKYAILAALPDAWIVPSARLEGDDAAKQVRELSTMMNDREWAFPIVLKPDAGERGAGVTLVHDADDARRYFEDNAGPTLVQTYDPGPLEAGIFYYRMPGEPRGRIFSITDKVFPFVVGDGKATLERLVWRHPRYRMQAGTFLKRFDDERERVPAAGERVRLAVAGNHCQGTLFRDGAHLITDDLERVIDEIAQSFDGFFFGRFDVRYADTQALERGEGFAILELNGVTSESTNIYDPDRSLLFAYRTLIRQWALAFRIGTMNRARGHRATAPGAILRALRNHYGRRRVELVSD